MSKEKKDRPKEYDQKVAINGTFADVIKVSVKPKAKKTATKKPAKAKK